jgi:hypothetical protein
MTQATRCAAFRLETKYAAYWPSSKFEDGWISGVLFVNGESMIVGAAAFNRFTNPQSYKLMWVWIANSARRKGLLKTAWPQFLEWYGEFDIEEPLSNALRGFLGTLSK